MKCLAILALLTAVTGWAQISNPGVIYVNSAPTGACIASPPLNILSSTGAAYSCNNGTWGVVGGGGGMIYPGAGIAVSTGAAWGTSLTAPTGAIVGAGQVNTYTTGLQDFSGATMKQPSTYTVGANTITNPVSAGTLAITSQLTASGVGLGSVTNDAQTKAAIVPNSFAGVRFGNSGTIDTAATTAQIQTVIGAGVYDASGAAAARAAAGTCTNQVVTATGTSSPTCTTVTGAYIASATVTATQLAAQYSKGSCTEAWGGSGTAFALTAGDDAISNNSCYNDSGVTRTITAVKCRSDNASNTTTVNPTFGAAGTGTTILSGALTCGNSYAYSASGTVTNASWTTGTGIDPAMGGTLTGTSIAVIIEFTY
jgi:hypothetical protein